MITNEEIILEYVKCGELSIDTNGQIWRHSKRIGGRKNKLINIQPTRAENILPNGYYQIQVYKNGKVITCGAHRLVWNYFYGKIPKDFIIHHIDENKQNNNPVNIVCTTHSQHNKIHPKKVWNKKAIHENDIQEKIDIWHNKTVISRRNNYLEKIKKTFQMCNGVLTQQEVAGMLNVSRRTVCKHLYDYRNEVVPI